MPSATDPPFESQPQGISLDELAEAFAQVMGVEPRLAANSIEATNDTPATDQSADAPMPPAETSSPEPMGQDDTCPVSPCSILEAMLFVGNRENRPLTPARVAEFMRDVSADEIPTLVDDLNRRYAGRGAAYRIVGEGDGYRLMLREAFRPLRNRFYGRIRQARLSQAAIDVLALVAYQQPITSEKIGRLRGKPSSHVLAHLVRRGLLRIERSDIKRRVPHYRTTDRFLKLFNLQSLEDLPRSEDATLP